MSFSYNKTGSVAEVQEDLGNIVQHDELGQKTKDFILDVLAMESDKVASVIVHASGHSDATNATVDISISTVMEHGHAEDQ